MDLKKAVYAFYKALILPECPHGRIHREKDKAFCPDCGYKVQTVWTLLKCHGCGSKRIPKRSLSGDLEPLYRHCQYCGAAGFYVVKRDHIGAHEVPYAVSVTEVDYREERKVTPLTPNPYATNPFRLKPASHVVEGQVVNARYV